MTVQSHLYSLADIAAEARPWQLNVPIYQRLYVWGEDQVGTLLADVVDACRRDEPLFFLGGVLLVEQTDDPLGTGARTFDLIDGQQRMTTLWLLSCAWGGALRPFLTTTTQDDKPRLRFAIRDEVDGYLQTLVDVGPQGARRAADALANMQDALAAMGAVLQTHDAGDVRSPGGAITLERLADYAFRRVKFVVTVVPRETDLNKLFEVINNRGVQLQHHEILKARMLEALEEQDRRELAVLWDACADMNSYVERAFAGITGVPAHEVQPLWSSRRLADAQAVRQLLRTHRPQGETHHSLALEDILAGEPDAAQVDKGGRDEDTHTARVRSIIGFPLLLQHVLRIWLHRHGRADLPRVLDRDLLTLFEEHFSKPHKGLPAHEVAEMVRSFVSLLWRIRVLFDDYVVKWVDQGTREVHLLGSVSVTTSRGRSYISRSRESDAHRGLSLLQSMLYHSQEITTQYWLTPFLLHLAQHEGETLEAHFTYLQHLDNHLLTGGEDGPLVERTARFMRDPWRTTEPRHRSELVRSDGVRMAHYWFYKLEFVLWSLQGDTQPRWKSFRFTAKNSVEHVGPQTRSEHDTVWVEEMLDHFGNLALVSRSVNSEFSNNAFEVKQAQFLTKNREEVDSLKLDLIYNSGKQWDDAAARAHQAAMIDRFDTYLAQCARQTPVPGPPAIG